MSTRQRTLHQTHQAKPSQDGDGVIIHRLAGRHLNRVLDPFLLIDEINSDNAKDYIGGFPEHPHRGFETITYVKAGLIRHSDHMGNEGVIGPGDVQWMKAGAGIVHSEMPEQQNGLLHGFQIWLNLPANQKMQAPDYRDITADSIPALSLHNGGTIKVIAGDLAIDGKQLTGPMPKRTTTPLIADLELAASQTIRLTFEQALSATALVYKGSTTDLNTRQAGIYSHGESLSFTAGSEGASILLLAGLPLAEPIVQYGPFVMNSTAQIEQTLRDYQSGAFLSPALHQKEVKTRPLKKPATTI
ncbi:Putative quercetin 2,3-dioxygenase [BD1-7 clade bacterium]|uniref:Quercetin 2,3-dioxygenase n=1 Tax=BD1-7 clade bacterium TaxID=2029982 RepID=A0A5S9QRX6_9GAMM|nr:Putative quercetin 2,3-dioxygenase [BD1-7 clade bacterium]CAA0122273.1 Putative quercetin 2,3-dioxygenase [BD1-7 clade bacterium]